MAAALAQGAEVNGCVGEEEGRTALIGAAVGVRRRQTQPLLFPAGLRAPTRSGPAAEAGSAAR